MKLIQFGKKYRVLLSLCAAVFLLCSGCALGMDQDSPDETTSGTNGKIRMSLSITQENSRTIGYTIPTDVTYILIGAIDDGDYDSLGSWTDMTNAGVSLDAGTWNFIFDVYDNGTEKKILEGTITDQEISAPGTLSFTLTTLKNEDGVGTIDITLTWPSDSVVASVTTLLNNETVSPALNPVLDSAAGTYRVTYTNSEADPGTSLLVFKLYDDAEIPNLVASVTEVVWVGENLTSSKTIALTSDDLNAAPTAPTGLSAERVANTTSTDPETVNLAWTDASNTEAGFETTYSDDDGSTWSDTTIKADASATSSSDTVSRGTTRTYKVRAINSFGDSDWSDTASVTIPYLVQFGLDGGNIGGDTTNPTSQEVAPNGTVDLPDTAPVRNGYIFGGWSDGSTTYTESTQVTASATLIAQWNQYLTYTTDLDGNATITEYVAAYLPAALSIPSTIDGHTVTAIGDEVFRECNSLTSVTIPDSVVTIGDFAFYYCKNLSSLQLGNSVSSIGQRAFSDCNALKNVTIPDSVESLGSRVFFHSTGLESVTIGSGVTSIGESCFAYCSSLVSVTMTSSSPATLDPKGFQENSSERKIYVPESSYSTYTTATNWSGYKDFIYVVEGTITFNANASDATGSMADQILAGGIPTALTANGFSRNNHSFIGWATSTSATSADYADGADYTMKEGSTILYAVWSSAQGLSATESYPGEGSISFTGATSVEKGATLAISVNENFSSYQWYLDGTALSDAGAQTLSVGTSTSTWSIGRHTLSVVVVSGSNSYSASIIVKVTK